MRRASVCPYLYHMEPERLSDISSDLLLAIIQADDILKDNTNPFDCSQPDDDNVEGERGDEGDTDSPNCSSESGNDDPPFVTSDKSVTPRRSAAMDKLGQRLITYIKSEATQKYLFDVHDRKIKCERQTNWLNVRQHSSGLSIFESDIGPLNSEKQITEVSTFLRNLFRKRYGETDLMKLLHYIRAVWYPEAVKFALVNYFQMDDSEAEMTVQGDLTHFKDLSDSSRNTL
ncbi:unnamed protein product [Soboliphyme baturini]|uniref:DDE_Tnp_1_7 domain-containing protein n=1 Tax=Soboliphyme baturini TaxID=241478 RepID=A0A183IC40_9BILA|nr:unnamed protein product [Soboliphyme baturini]